MLQVENLTKTYTVGDNIGGGVRHVSFDVGPGEFYTLLGPSGCGKTTTLRCVAGLEEPTTGRVSINGSTVFDSVAMKFVPANQRNFGMVFQSYAVWPHMTVFENAAFPLRMSRARRWSEADIQRQVTKTLETMGLGEYAKRSAAQLSGGQQQRLSFARALVAEPRLLLLDEPLSNLDAVLREQMRIELRRLQKDVGIASIYVTHDQSEALALSDRIAVMRNGEIVQIGPPKQIYNQPENEFIATFIGRSNVLRGNLAAPAAGNERATVQTPLGPVSCECPTATSKGQPVTVVIRPEHVVLTGAGAAKPCSGTPVNRFRGRVAHVMFLGEATECLVQLSQDIEIIVRNGAGEFVGDQDVELFFPPERTLVVPGEIAARK